MLVNRVPSDISIMDACKADDWTLVETFKRTRAAQPFEVLFERYRERLYRVVYKLYRNVESAEDCVQESFRRAIQEIDQFGESNGEHNFWAWLVTIAKSVCMSDLRRKYLLAKHAAAWTLVGVSKAPISQDQRVMISELLRLIRSLPLQYRTCYLLLLAEGCTYQEIVSITGYTLGDVKAFVQTAKRHVQRQFSPASDSRKRVSAKTKYTAGRDAKRRRKSADPDALGEP